VVIFLHGSAGPFTLPCFQVARAVATEGFGTACPSSGFVGDWRAGGATRIRALLRTLRARGAKRVVLAGLSNGGFAALRLAPTLASELSGLVVIAAARAGAQPLPALRPLVLCGRQDPECQAGTAAAYASASAGRYAPSPGGHFAMAVYPDAYEPQLAAYVHDVKARKAVAPSSRAQREGE
jgi:pimeloyl-ACP methyl ester carboxylesterase